MKAKLIEALEKEKVRLDEFGADTFDHTLTIDYLKTGSYGCDPREVDNYPLLDCAINDYDQLVSDYLN